MSEEEKKVADKEADAGARLFLLIMAGIAVTVKAFPIAIGLALVGVIYPRILHA